MSPTCSSAMATGKNSMMRPSTRWSSFNGWDYKGMKERLEGLIQRIDKSALVRHAERITGQQVTMSQPFSAGQYWICFEMIAEDSSLIIARVRLPRHPDSPDTLNEQDELFSMNCEVATMTFVQQNLPAIAIPRLYAYEGPGSQLASSVGAIYMLLEGFYGNTLQDVEFNICNLPVSEPSLHHGFFIAYAEKIKIATQEHIITQWTKVQTEIATLSFAQIGSISSVLTTGEAVIGKLATAPIEGLKNYGPFSKAEDYFAAMADAAIRKLSPSHTGSHTGPDDSLAFAIVGAFIFHNIVQNTAFFTEHTDEQFPLNHMDLGPQNILVDDEFNFLAIIDWEFAQTAPWAVNYYPMPFPLLGSDAEIKAILKDPNHCAHSNVSRQESARRLYVQKFREAEGVLQKEGRTLGGSFADTLDSPSSRIYACFSRLGGSPEADEALAREMVRLAFDLDAEETERYLHKMEGKARQAVDVARAGMNCGR